MTTDYVKKWIYFLETKQLFLKWKSYVLLSWENTTEYEKW